MSHGHRTSINIQASKIIGDKESEFQMRMRDNSKVIEQDGLFFLLNQYIKRLYGKQKILHLIAMQ
uniref:Uncharacterized protein n=1 Tax=Lepeophtheirus salmonis TaxID=72036 RepID=A0A0K2TWP4_LEPSM